MVSISKEVLDACERVIAKDGLQYVVMKIDDSTEELRLEDFSDHLQDSERSAGRACDTEEEVRQAFRQLGDIIREHRTRSPRFCLFNFSNSDKSKAALIYWSPVAALTLTKLRYNKAKQEVFASLSSHDVHESLIIAKNFEQLDYDAILQKL